ncbi:hypothetical protein F5Y18DRAFT_376279 [Xylariaceae sp. FL1019]|nr:hypothetical protein F5Y18DRAFT_376279 [Xylariaceae sp. FL1019]
MADKRNRHASSRRNQDALNSAQQTDWTLRTEDVDKTPKLKWGFENIAVNVVRIGDLDEHIMHAIPEGNRPTTVPIDVIRPLMLKALGRDENILLLDYLSKKELEAEVFERVVKREFPRKSKNETMRATCKYVYVSKEQKVKIDLAIIMICSIAVRTTAHSYRPLVGELIGLAAPETLKRLAKYPWLLPNDCAGICELAHAAARNVTQRRPSHQNKYGSRALYYLLPPIIATQLEGLWTGDRPEEHIPEVLLEDLMHLATNWDEGDDTGIGLGLVLAGIRYFFNNIQEEKGKKWDHVATGCKAIVSGLSGGFNPAGPAFAAARPAIDHGIQKIKERKMEKVQRDWNRVWDEFMNQVETCIGRDSEEEKIHWEKYCAKLKEVMDAEPPKLKKSTS